MDKPNNQELCDTKNLIAESLSNKALDAMDTKETPRYPFEVLYKGGKEFEENLKKLNAEHVREYNLLQEQNPQTEEEFRRQVEKSRRLSEERMKRLSEA